MTPIADQHAAIAARQAQLQAEAQAALALVYLAAQLPPGVTIGPARQRELTTAELTALYLATP